MLAQNRFCISLFKKKEVIFTSSTATPSLTCNLCSLQCVWMRPPQTQTEPRADQDIQTRLNASTLVCTSTSHILISQQTSRKQKIYRSCSRKRFTEAAHESVSRSD